MIVDYNNFAKTFSSSRKNMKWEEIEYFLSFLGGKEKLSILDVGCGNGRFLGELKKSNLDIEKYLGIDLSKGLLQEAKKINPDNEFRELNMLDLDKLEGSKFDCIFFIASFHHLDSSYFRLEVLEKAKKLLNPGGIIMMTNWSLESELNKEKYSKSKITGSENIYGSKDFSIKIGAYTRYYHSFDLSELEFLFNATGYELIENREFNNKRNFISIIKKI